MSRTILPTFSKHHTGRAAAVAAVVDAVRGRLGGIDFIVHVDGGPSAAAGGVAVLDNGEWHRAFDLHLVRLPQATFAFTQRASGAATPAWSASTSRFSL